MEYKVLIKIYFPLIEESFELYIPTTHTLNYIARMAQKAVVDNYNKSYVIKEGFIPPLDYIKALDLLIKEKTKNDKEIY